MSHAVWKKAIEQVSAGALTADIQYIADFDQFVAQVVKLTGISSAKTLGTVLSAVMVKTPVLTSVESIGNNKYAGGHIVTLLGIDASVSSPPPIAVLNPAVKVGSVEKVICEMNGKIGDEKYQAFATIEEKYELKKFPQGYLLITIKKK
jgi:hypothetical protein